MIGFWPYPGVSLRFKHTTDLINFEITEETHVKYLELLGSQFYESVVSSIDRFKNKSKDLTQIAQVAANSLSFMKSQVSFFWPQKLDQLMRYCRGSSKENKLFIVKGISGSGKTHLISKAIENCLKDGEEKIVIARFCGETLGIETATEVQNTLTEHVKVLDKFYNPNTKANDFDGHLMSLAKSNRKSKIFIFIESLDALNDLSESNIIKKFAWLSENLPQNVRIIMSTGCGPKN